MLERVKALEAEKANAGGEFKRMGRREGSLIRERRRGEREGKGEGGRENERWDWEGGGLGMGRW